MNLFIGFLFVIVAGIFQGSFILPMTLTRRWSWEHTWAAFSFFGMLVFNWIIAFIAFPDIIQMYRAVSPPQIFELALLGAGWGVGAILFGLGMDKLGMALGYPIIMGLIASLGAVIPLLFFFSGQILSPKGILTLGGTAIVVVGIVLCSIAGTRKQQTTATNVRTGSTSLGIGLIIAIFAGILSCLPNVGMAFAIKAMESGKNISTSSSAGNAVWILFFTAGFVVNLAYCFYRMHKNKNLQALCNQESGRNFLLTALMGIMWVGSFYLYGLGAAELGKWGAVIGWPIFISLSIVVGAGWGLGKGEWVGSSPHARRWLYLGIAVLLLSVITIASTNLL